MKSFPRDFPGLSEMGGGGGGGGGGKGGREGAIMSEIILARKVSYAAVQYACVCSFLDLLQVFRFQLSPFAIFENGNEGGWGANPLNPPLGTPLLRDS